MKKLEKLRYDKRASKIKKNLKDSNSKSFSKHIVPAASKVQYDFYENLIKEKVKEGMQVLEIGCGTGESSWQAINSGANIILTDISPISLDAAKYRFRKKNKNLEFIEADMEKLPFEKEKFDIILCAGSLSYGEHDLVRREIFRVLKLNGFFICIDSLDHNIIYRLNRIIHFIRGIRTWLTISRIPKLKLIKSYKQFGWGEHYYFGSFFWLTKLLESFINSKSLKKLSIFLDKFFGNHLTAFNFVMVVKKTKKYL